ANEQGTGLHHNVRHRHHGVGSRPCGKLADSLSEFSTGRDPTPYTDPSVSSSTPRTVFAILAAISFSHLLNDLVQSLLPAIYPMLKTRFALDFWQVGLITLTNQLTASLLQPLVGLYTDRRPQPYLLSVGMAVTLCGL